MDLDGPQVSVDSQAMVVWVHLDGGVCDCEIDNVDRVDSCIFLINDFLPSMKNKVPLFLPSDVSLLLLVTEN